VASFADWLGFRGTWTITRDAITAWLLTSGLRILLVSAFYHACGCHAHTHRVAHRHAA
jgi:hypothetical protein